jgi:hypothetical protein
MEGIPVETAAINEICKNFVEIQGAFHWSYKLLIIYPWLTLVNAYALVINKLFSLW